MERENERVISNYSLLKSAIIDGLVHVQLICQTSLTDFSGDVFWADQRFGEALDFFIGLDIPFHIDTNGTHITEEALQRLFVSKVASVNVSIDAAEQETYKRIRKGSPPLDTVFANMDLLSQFREKTPRKDINLSAAFVMMRSNIKELPKFIERVAKAKFDAVRTIHMQAYTADVVDESLWFQQELFNEIRAISIDRANELGIELHIDRAFDDRDDQIGTSLCSLPWNAAYVIANGDVLACCVPGLHMGNLHEQSMEAIWNGPKYQELRRTVNSDERRPACKACPFNRKTNNPLSYYPVNTINVISV